MFLCCFQSQGSITRQIDVAFDDDEKIQRTKLLLNCDDNTILSFYKLFCKIDKSNKGEIMLDHLFASFFRRNRSVIGDAVFEIVECSKDPERVDFGTFCLGICTFCTCNQTSDLIRIIFFIYDKEKRGYIMRTDFVRFLELTNCGVISEKLSNILELFPSDKIDFDELCKISKAYSIILYPIVNLQNTFKISCFGLSWWIEKTRSKASKK